MHMRWTKLVTAASSAALLLTTSVRAAEPTPGVDPVARFKELSVRAETAFQGHQYQAAVDAYLEAYGVLPSADVLYNIAYIYDHHLQNMDLAQDFYRRVVRTPDSTKEILELSMKRLAELEARSNARAPLLVPDNGGNGGVNNGNGGNGGVSGGVKLPPKDDGVGPAPWVFIALGGASVIGATVMGIVAQGTHDDFENASDVAGMESLEKKGKDQALAADILGIGGGVLLGTGIILFFANGGADGGASSTSDASFELPAVRPLLAPGAVGLSWEGKL